MGNLFKKNIDANSKIGKDSACPICGRFFGKKSTYSELDAHIDSCAKNQDKKKEEEKVEELDNRLEGLDSKLKQHLNDLMNLQSTQTSTMHNDTLLKVKRSLTNTGSNSATASALKNNPYISKKVLKMSSLKTKPDATATQTHNKVSNILIDSNNNFEQKLQIFRLAMKSLKTSWTEGACTLTLTRDGFLKESIKQLKTIDIYKELKINFKGEISNDAGGLIREWYTIIFKELQSKSKELFEPSDTDEFSYLINSNIEQTLENLDIFYFIGRIIGKALLDNLTINTCFNKYIFKLLIGEKVTFDSLVFINKSLFNSLNELKKLETLEGLELFYELQYKVDGRLVTDELIPNGSHIPVTDINDYIDQRLKYMINKDNIFINEIKSGLTSVIPEKFITCFNSDEFELLLNGVPFIDLEDWKTFTTYKNKYSPSHKIIKWFWEILNTYSQSELRNFLQFCTGTSRVPIGGFASLESNRGEISHFCIVSVDLYPKSKNFIKAHTCFNRVDLPMYNTKIELADAMEFIRKNEIFGFGID